MRNPYYFLFYVMFIFLKWLNKWYKGYVNYAFRAVGVVSLFMCANLLSLAFLLIDFHYVYYSTVQVYVICLFLTVLVFGMNFHFLYKNGKAQIIIETYDGMYHGKRPGFWELVGTVCYGTLSMVVFSYLAYLEHEHKLVSHFANSSA